MDRIEKPIQQKKLLQTWEELKELRIKKLCAEIDSSVNNMVSYHIPMETLREDVESFKGGNITNFFKKWAITQDQFILNIVKFGLAMEFAEVPVFQFVPPLNFSPVETEIIDAEISKLLSKGVIVSNTKEPCDYLSRIITRTKKDGSYRMVLNLKTFNEFLKFKHWKLEPIKDALKTVPRRVVILDLLTWKMHTIASLFMKITQNIWNCSGRKNTINIFFFQIDFYQLWESLQRFWLLHSNILGKRDICL